MILEGYAALWGERAFIGEDLERLEPGAFLDAIRGGQVLACLDHKFTIARQGAGLWLEEDRLGLHVAIEPQRLGLRILRAYERGGIAGLSFAWYGQLEARSVPLGKGELRIVTGVPLVEVSVLLKESPAYTATKQRIQLSTGAAARSVRRLLRRGVFLTV